MTTDVTDAAKYDRKRRARLDDFTARHCAGNSTGERFYAGLASGITESATAYAKSVQMEAGYRGEEDLGYSDFDQLLIDALLVVENIMNGLNGWECKGEYLRAWRHNASAVQAVMERTGPDMGRQEIEYAVSGYLALPFRRERFDRLFVDLLMALELYAFGRESRGEIRRHSLWGWLRYRVYSGIFWAIVIWLGWKTADWNWVSRDTAGTIQIVCLVLFSLESVLSLYALFRPSIRGKVLGEMNSAYAELNSDGPISAARIEERVKAAANAGVIWPAPLYVLLEDSKSRGGKF